MMKRVSAILPQTTALIESWPTAGLDVRIRMIVVVEFPPRRSAKWRFAANSGRSASRSIAVIRAVASALEAANNHIPYAEG
jgi:hypothetical protein